MNAHRPARLLATAATIVCACAAAIGAAAAPAGTRAAAAGEITASGVGGVKLGTRYTTLRQQHLVAKISQGCELGGPNTRSARLRAPLKGSVDFTLTSPRKVANITVTGGATARGIGIGATIAQVKAAFHKAKVDHSTEQTFAITLVKIPKTDGGRLQFAVDTTTKKVTLIGIPFIAFCE